MKMFRLFQWLKHLFIEEYDNYDYTVLSKYKKGKLVVQEDEDTVNTLATVGLIHLGLHEHIDADGFISYQQTAKCTNFGREILKYMRL